VIHRFVESEGFVRSGQSLLEVGDPKALEVIVEALTSDAVRVGPGTPVQLLRWGGDAPLRGHVQTIEPGGFTKFSALGVEEQRVLIVIALDDARKPPILGDGFRVEAEFQVWGADDVLTVPVAALFRDGTLLVGLCDRERSRTPAPRTDRACRRRRRRGSRRVARGFTGRPVSGRQPA
jgi:HlyD family secretion protein